MAKSPSKEIQLRDPMKALMSDNSILHLSNHLLSYNKHIVDNRVDSRAPAAKLEVDST